MTLPKLFACMIIRNEAHNLDRCLSSIRDLCDEIVIVDTGSMDNSIEVARKYGAIVYPSLQMQYRKAPVWDFSFARNQAIQYCADLGADWTLTIDGDESLKPLTITPEEFKYRLTKLMPEIHSLHVQCHERYKNEDGFTFWHVRFFRVSDGFHYENIVHNSPVLPEGAKSAGTNLVLYHYGYSDPVVMQKKRERSLPLLDRRLRENPRDFDAMFYKSMIHLGQDEYDEGIKWAEECVRIMDEESHGDYSTIAFYGKIYASMGSFFLHRWAKTRNQLWADRAFQWLSKGLQFWPDDLDLNFVMTQLYWCAENPYKVREHGQKYKDALEKYWTQEKVPNPDTFMSPLDLQGAVLTKRSLHTATKECEAKVDAMMREAA